MLPLKIGPVRPKREVLDKHIICLVVVVYLCLPLWKAFFIYREMVRIYINKKMRRNKQYA